MILLAAGGVGAGCGGRQKQAAEAEAAASQPLPLGSFGRLWATNVAVGNDRLTQLHVRDAAIYAYTRGGAVATMDRESGRLQYAATVKNGRGELHPPVVMTDRVVFPTNTSLESFAPDGRYLKSTPLKFALRSHAVGGADGLVFVGADYEGSGRAVALDPDEAYVPTKWEMMVPRGGISASPAVSGDAVYVGARDGNVYAVTAAERAPVWPTKGTAFSTGGAIVADLVADDKAVYVASTDSKLYALDAATGKILWQYYASQGLDTAPAVASDTVYQFVAGTGLVALAKNEGAFVRAPLWVAADATQFLAQDDRNAYVRSSDGSIVAHDKRTGEVKFTSQRRDLKVFGTNTTKDDGTIYAATAKGRVLAIRPILRPGVVGELVLRDAPLEPMAAAR
jgi:outer membrane protein assembly factor BamB